VADSRRPLSPADVIERVRAQFGEDVSGAEEVFCHPVITVMAGRYHELAEFLRDEPDLDFDYFDFLTGIDWRPKGRGFEVVTHVFSTSHNHHVRVKVECDGEDPRCPSIFDVWDGANWFERETWGFDLAVGEVGEASRKLLERVAASPHLRAPRAPLG